MGIGNHNTIYFDKIERTNKLQTLLALANAALNIKDKEEVKKQLQYSLNMFKPPKSENELGAGSYVGKTEQWNSKYTLSRDLGLFEDSKNELVLSELGQKLANGIISAKYYISTVMLNNIQIINGKVVNLLWSIIIEMEKQGVTELKKIKLFDIEDFNLGGSDTNGYINGLVDLLQSTYFFEKNDKKNIRLTKEFMDIKKLKEIINTDFIADDYKSVKGLSNFDDQKQWCEYLGKENKKLQLFLCEDNNCEKENEVVKCKLRDELKDNYNRIVFGAPGTGKSHGLEIDRKDFGDNYERVTFHPNYSYSSFVGTYKPVPKEDVITYEYIPGPFMRILVKAMKNKEEAFLLLIEEINRANVSAVFGEVFQLLDRTDGESTYEIETSEDMRRFFAKELGGKEEEYKKIKIPSNMYIWATMNSADQGVFPMDTAFKRRWEFEYIDIDQNEEQIKDIIVYLGEDNRKVKWNDLRKEINNNLLNKCKVNEDKLLGPYFISKSALEHDPDTMIVNDNKKFLDVFKSKVIMYIFEDAAGRQHRSNIFKEFQQYNTYSKICKSFDKIGEKIFGFDLELQCDESVNEE